MATEWKLTGHSFFIGTDLDRFFSLESDREFTFNGPDGETTYCPCEIFSGTGGFLISGGGIVNPKTLYNGLLDMKYTDILVDWIDHKRVLLDVNFTVYDGDHW